MRPTSESGLEQRDPGFEFRRNVGNRVGYGRPNRGILHDQFNYFAGRHGIYLEDLFVRPALRGNGIGKALLVHLAKECAANGWSQLQWAVLDWNAPSIAFYKSLGAVMMEEWTLCRLTGPSLASLAKGAP